MTSSFGHARARLLACANESDARVLSSFSKTGPGGYAEGHVFLGIRAPVVRQLAREFADLPEKDILSLLQCPEQEARTLALVIIGRRCEKGDEATRRRIFDLYLANTRFIDDWGLVDISAPGIVGRHLEGAGDRAILRRLARSSLLWERRIAMVSCLWFIRRGEFADALDVAEILLSDSHDLIHKAAGWMLREIGNRNLAAEVAFLEKHADAMPRTMLRYAIEKFDPSMKAAFMARGAEYKKRRRGAIAS